MTPEEIDLHNHAVILDFLNSSPVAKQCDISNIVKATICQFLTNLKIEINRVAKNNRITPEQIIQSQIDVLRGCIVDLNDYKERITTGVIKQ